MSRVAKWANDPASKSLFEAAPVKGDLGILFLHETASHSYLSKDTAGGHWYPQALRGACRGFINNNLQADWVGLAQKKWTVNRFNEMGKCFRWLTHCEFTNKGRI